MKLPSNKIKSIIGLIGVLFIILAPVIGMIIPNQVLHTKTSESVPDNSDVSFTNADAYAFTLGENEKITIKFWMSNENMSVSLFILGQGTYDTFLSDNTTAPNIIPGIVVPAQPALNFIQDTPAFGATPAGNTVNQVTILYDGFFRIEFMGTVTGGRLSSIPGQYVIVVYGDNDVIDVDCSYNLLVMKDGLDKSIAKIGTIIGIILIVAAGVLLFLDKKGGVE